MKPCTDSSLLPLCWLALTVIVFPTHQPWWTYYYIHSVTNGYDHFMRRTNVVLRSGQSQVLAVMTNSFDTASRLHLVAAGAQSAVYSYLANSPLVEQIVFKQSGSPVMTTTKSDCRPGAFGDFESSQHQASQVHAPSA